MIPEFNQSGVLPPFNGKKGPTDIAGMSPYRATISEFVTRYSNSPERRRILKGFLAYREKLRSIGVLGGFQWIDGSFVENVELNRGRPPADMDIVTFATRPTNDNTEWKFLVEQNIELFTRKIHLK